MPAPSTMVSTRATMTSAAGGIAPIGSSPVEVYGRKNLGRGDVLHRRRIDQLRLHLHQALEQIVVRDVGATGRVRGCRRSGAIRRRGGGRRGGRAIAGVAGVMMVMMAVRRLRRRICIVRAGAAAELRRQGLR